QSRFAPTTTNLKRAASHGKGVADERAAAKMGSRVAGRGEEKLLHSIANGGGYSFTKLVASGFHVDGWPSW
ncbi:hypothetical protein Tco_0041458, partial [Tanacetum coccineum]